MTNTLILDLQLVIYHDIKQQSSGLNSLNIKVLSALHGQKDGLKGSRKGTQLRNVAAMEKLQLHS
jgi:hypothetical protein